MSIEINRLIIQFEDTVKQINKEIIDPEIPSLTLDKLSPVIGLAARARAAYLKELFNTAADSGDDMPSSEQTEKIRNLRITYEEYAAGAQALEIAIQRGYLEIN